MSKRQEQGLGLVNELLSDLGRAMARLEEIEREYPELGAVIHLSPVKVDLRKNLSWLSDELELARKLIEM